MDDAATLLELSGISAVLYTSPSHTQDRPRWRILAPFSMEYSELGVRRIAVGRINAALGGILAPESFTLSQSFYFGAVIGSDYRYSISRGEYIDLITAIDPLLPQTLRHGATPASEVTDETIEELRSALAMIPADDRDIWIRIGQALACLGQIGFDLWDEWSRKSEKYNPDDMWRFETFSGDRTDYRAIFAEAQRLGWINPRAHVRTPLDVESLTWDVVPALTRTMPLTRRLNQMAFPDHTLRMKPVSTAENLRYLLDQYGITYYYDVILKDQVLWHPDYQAGGDLMTVGLFQAIKSLLARNEVPLETTDRLSTLLMGKTINPIKDWITSIPWDGVSRLDDFYSTVIVAPEDIHYRNLVLRTWLIQCVAAMDAAESTPRRDAIKKFECVLIFQSHQGAYKTSWIDALVPKHYKAYIKDSTLLHTDNKDSIKAAVSAWITELGELDSTFRKSDMSRIKAFLSTQVDEIRLPYDKAASKFQRRTSFFASVNEVAHLIDETGNRRFLPIAIIGTYSNHTVNMQQLWAEVWTAYLAGEAWWPDSELVELLKIHHHKHSQEDPIEDAIRSKFEVEMMRSGGKHYSCTEILQECGWNHISKADLNAVGRFMRKIKYPRTTVNGKSGWRMRAKLPGE